MCLLPISTQASRRHLNVFRIRLLTSRSYLSQLAWRYWVPSGCYRSAAETEIASTVVGSS